MEPVLNEISLVPLPSVQEARQAAAELLDVVRAVHRVLHTRTLLISRDCRSRPIADNYTLSGFLGDRSVDREARLYLQSAITRESYVDDSLNAAVETRTSQWFYKERSVLGLGFAHLMQLPAVSLRSVEHFPDPCPILVRRLTTNGDIVDSEEEVICFSTEEQVAKRADWLSDQLFGRVRTGQELWQKQTNLLPFLHFGPNVESQITSLTRSHDHFALIVRHLVILNDTAEGWKPGANFEPPLQWSPETEQTLNHPNYGPQRVFQCSDGATRTFSRHTKIRSANFRIYFYPDQPGHPVHIGYIGRHLQSVEYPT